ncbi:MAG: hypothetical protein KL787_03425 [Taibaiella sp.]|nr:hypothetical protein [Taibaiella sp.]
MIICVSLNLLFFIVPKLINYIKNRSYFRGRLQNQLLKEAKDSIKEGQDNIEEKRVRTSGKKSPVKGKVTPVKKAAPKKAVVRVQKSKINARGIPPRPKK